VQFSTITLERGGGVATLILNRPDRLNAINGRMSRELEAAWQQIERDPEVGVVVVSGAGDRALSTGFDVADVAAGTAEVGGEADRGKLSSLKLTGLQNRCTKPVITAVNGMVCGGGLHFVADSDLVVAADHATFFDTHVNVGLVAGLEPIGLARRIPLEPVLKLALAGKAERMDARRALQIGLVGEVVPKAELMSHARHLAERILEASPAAIARTKRAIWESLNVGLDQALELGWSIIEEHVGHPDVVEGARAFAEKRKARWLAPGA
jgi:enoyl-CoA hydratase/carnithine racemase